MKRVNRMRSQHLGKKNPLLEAGMEVPLLQECTSGEQKKSKSRHEKNNRKQLTFTSLPPHLLKNINHYILPTDPHLFHILARQEFEGGQTERRVYIALISKLRIPGKVDAASLNLDLGYYLQYFEAILVRLKELKEEDHAFEQRHEGSDSTQVSFFEPEFRPSMPNTDGFVVSNCYHYLKYKRKWLIKNSPYSTFLKYNCDRITHSLCGIGSFVLLIYFKFLFMAETGILDYDKSPFRRCLDDDWRSLCETQNFSKQLCTPPL